MAKIEKLFKRFHSTIDDGDFYEAHQICRLIHNRLSGDSSSFESLSKMLWEGLFVLANKEQLASAQDLALLYLNILEQGSIPYTDEISKNFTFLLQKIPVNLLECSDKSDNRSEIIGLMVNYSKKIGKNAAEKFYGAEDVLNVIGEQMLLENNCNAALNQFILANNAPKLAETVLKLSAGFSGIESDGLLATTVYQLLCLKKTNMASILLRKFAANHILYKFEKPAYSGNDTLNYIWLLIAGLKAEAKNEVTALVSKTRFIDEGVVNGSKYVSKIMNIYFGIAEEEKAQNNNMMSQLMANMTGGNKTKKAGESSVKEFSDCKEGDSIIFNIAKDLSVYENTIDNLFGFEDASDELPVVQAAPKVAVETKPSNKGLVFDDDLD
uniref:COP9 signalosome complex subunit 4 n=1 Tax=Rhabditophanes sp. KR3021 TaxID=114890 RepID=A0AC35TRM5_9BILA